MPSERIREEENAMDFEDAGASNVTVPRAAPGDQGSDVLDAGSPPQWLVDEIESLRTAEEESAERGDVDAGPGPSS